MKALKKPQPKKFNSRKYKNAISKLRKNTPGRVIEKSCEKIAIDILRNYEGFKKVKKGPDFTGTPFDFFGFKDGVPYIIEMKCSLKTFNTPGETQKRRMQELLKKVRGLKVALLQIKLRKSEYRIFYHDDMQILFKGREAPIEPIVEWVRERL